MLGLGFLHAVLGLRVFYLEAETLFEVWNSILKTLNTDILKYQLAPSSQPTPPMRPAYSTASIQLSVLATIMFVIGAFIVRMAMMTVLAMMTTTMMIAMMAIKMIIVMKVAMMMMLLMMMMAMAMKMNMKRTMMMMIVSMIMMMMMTVSMIMMMMMTVMVMMR